MDKQLLDEVIACLPEGRTFFHYHRDRYVLLLLEELARRSGVTRISDIKRGPYAHWLQKGFVKEWLAAQGRADVPVQELLSHWPAGLPHFPYLLSLGEWGHERRDVWKQTSRPGWNLVLRLNLPMQHQRYLCRVGGAQDLDDLQWGGHPIDGDRLTLAWARIDLDFATGEALIEEIQSDWTRDIAAMKRCFQRARSNGRSTTWWFGKCVSLRVLEDYVAEFQTQERMWHEAMLSATLWFLWRELGIRRVFYHSWETGNVLKQFARGYSVPPRSLYTDLPERFGFRRVPAGPAFIESDRHVRKLKAKLQQQRKPATFSWYHWAA
jgi:hypothetical protein